MRIGMRSVLPAALLLVALHQATAQEYAGNDLRDLKIGGKVADLPAAGYVDFSCAADANAKDVNTKDANAKDTNAKPAGWSAWRDCPAGADGLHALHFGFDPATSKDGTIVAGHPVVLTALIDKDGIVTGLEIDTDPKTRLYLRKKAFLFGPQVKARYGSDGWACTQADLAADEEPVGGVHVKEKCTKTTEGRAITVQRSLYRKAGQDEKNFVDETKVTILRASATTTGSN
ncbi:MAG: hypothetical protein JO141_21370 [Bradyrhizobium sp.]|nr:hypothetical protein [Bradyrhizobium sp.]